MQLIPQLPAKSLQLAHLRQNLTRKEVDTLKINLLRLFARAENAENNQESEENLKKIVSDFLEDTYYKGINEINTKDRKDLVIHQNKTANSPVSVILEVKRPTNKSEMISAQNPNVKALQELLHYFLQESFINGNKEIKHLIITNIYEWYIFDAEIFEKEFFRNANFVKKYKEWTLGNLGTDWLYKELLKPFIENELGEIPCAYFNLKDYKEIVQKTDNEEDKKLISLYKIFSPAHLLKHSFANDANTLNKEFYFELLYILGLEEVKEGGKKFIRRVNEKDRNEGSLLENTLSILGNRQRLKVFPHAKQFGETEEEQLFSIALELCITWLNRILFLKLLEGQIVKYHRNKPEYLFLHSQNIQDFDELNELFFEVLAIPIVQRTENVNKKYGNLPYLNSSLFDETELETQVLSITGLKNRLLMPVYAQTVLRNEKDKRVTGEKNTLTYLFQFLNSYDFSGDSQEIQSDKKTIINSAVLGLIFEKINGYKDGSFFTPSYITMYMCRETIRKAVVQKFNAKYNWKCENFEDLKDNIEFTNKAKRKEANEIINSMKVCDPSVGSGHFLVSALNELVAVKSELDILCYKDGMRIRQYRIELEQDEILFFDRETNQLFEYRLNEQNGIVDYLQEMQEAIFYEKQIIIENCLFGVDINAKSVSICRLRLWIELLKNMYYRASEKNKYVAGELETLPNLDVNIKVGNSLISRYALNTDLTDVFKSQKYSIKTYKMMVEAYKNTKTYQGKQDFMQFLKEIKAKFKENISIHDPLKKKLSELNGKRFVLENKQMVGDLFGKSDIPQDEKMQKETLESIKKAIFQAEQELSNKENSVLYRNAFEWRFEFPEVLDDNGEYVGFDIVVGNPPYIVNEQQVRNYEWAAQNHNTYVAFVELSQRIGNKNAQVASIIPSTWLSGNNYSIFRKKLISNKHIKQLIQLPYNIFDVYVDTLIAQFDFNYAHENVEVYKFEIKDSFDDNINYNKITVSDWEKDNNYTIFLDKDLSSFLHKFQFIPSYKLAEIASIQRGTLPPAALDLKPTKTAQSNIKWFSGQIYRYIKTEKETYYVDYSILKENKPISLFQTKKILARQLVSRQFRLQFHYIEEEFAFKKNLYAIYNLKEEIHYFYLLAILNSRFFSFIQITFNTSGQRNDFPAFSLKDFKEFLIPKLNEFEQKPFIELVQNILLLKKADVQANTVDLEAKIDTLVYKLYNLTAEEITLIEGKT
jgi:hypothetical protein